MLKKLLSLVGLTTKAHLAKSLIAIENSRVESLQAEQKHYRETLDILEKEYNQSLSILQATNLALVKENQDLLKDVALALYERPTKHNGKSDKMISIEEKPVSVKSKYDPAVHLKKDSQSMIERLEAKLVDIPNGVRGAGGIDIIKNGKIVVKEFSSKEELVKILQDAKAGKIELAKQAGL